MSDQIPSEKDYSPNDLMALCNVKRDAVYNNAYRIRGFYRFGRFIRFKKSEIDTARSLGQDIIIAKL